VTLNGYFRLENNAIQRTLIPEMTAAAKKLAEQVLALPESDRETLFKLLRDSLPHGDETLSQEEWDGAWKKELEKRIEEIESGKVKCIPYAEVRKGWDKILRKS
jgi:putative addiction module component (TIGR02574 family)